MVKNRPQTTDDRRQINTIFLKVIFLCVFVSNSFSAPYYDKFFLNGLKQIEQQQYAEAVKSFSLYLAKDSTKAVAYYNRAIAYKNLGDSGSAITDLERVLELDLGDTLAKKHLSQLLYEDAIQKLNDGDTATALVQLEKYLGRNPKDDVAWFNRGVIGSAKKEKQIALENFSKAIVLNPLPEYYLSRAIEYFKSDDFENALPDLERVLNDSPLDTTALWLRAQIYFHQKKDGAAKNDLGKLLEQKPDFESAQSMLDEIKLRIFLQKNIYFAIAILLLSVAALYFSIRALIRK
jgi:tetratricopeptide (TPR) repeat protein